MRKFQLSFSHIKSVNFETRSYDVSRNRELKFNCLHLIHRHREIDNRSVNKFGY